MLKILIFLIQPLKSWLNNKRLPEDQASAFAFKVTYTFYRPSSITPSPAQHSVRRYERTVLHPQGLLALDQWEAWVCWHVRTIFKIYWFLMLNTTLIKRLRDLYTGQSQKWTKQAICKQISQKKKYEEKKFMTKNSWKTFPEKQFPEKKFLKRKFLKKNLLSKIFPKKIS